MIRAVIIDDEPNNVTNLAQLLERHCPPVSVAGTAYDSKAGQDVIQSVRPDLLFLDISMPECGSLVLSTCNLLVSNSFPPCFLKVTVFQRPLQTNVADSGVQPDQTQSVS